ncbi:MAG: hypothetical protein ACLGIC_05705 [Acidimicrobiia bacterium]
MTPHRRLRLMWDWFAFPVWDIDAGENITSLPISHQLRDDLQRWSDEWSDLHWPPDVDDPPLATSAQEASHRQQASELADRLSQELGDGYEVVLDV